MRGEVLKIRLLLCQLLGQIKSPLGAGDQERQRQGQSRAVLATAGRCWRKSAQAGAHRVRWCNSVSLRVEMHLKMHLSDLVSTECCVNHCGQRVGGIDGAECHTWNDVSKVVLLAGFPLAIQTGVAVIMVSGSHEIRSERGCRGGVPPECDCTVRNIVPLKLSAQRGKK